MEDYDYPTQDEYFDGLEEEIHSFEANSFDKCICCDELTHIDSLHDGKCEDCWDNDY